MPVLGSAYGYHVSRKLSKRTVTESSMYLLSDLETFGAEKPG